MEKNSLADFGVYRGAKGTQGNLDTTLFFFVLHQKKKKEKTDASHKRHSLPQKNDPKNTEVHQRWAYALAFTTWGAFRDLRSVAKQGHRATSA
jgi:hypothetical protein